MYVDLAQRNHQSKWSKKKKLFWKITSYKTASVSIYLYIYFLNEWTSSTLKTFVDS